MGCTNSNPKATEADRKGEKPGKRGNIRYKDMTELDDLRVKFILDYWYDHANINN